VAKKRWVAGNIVSKALDDGWTYYARLLEFPWAVFYRHRTKQATDDLAKVVASPVLFTIAAHKDLLANGEWNLAGHVRLDGALQPPHAQAVWDVVDSTRCKIIDDQGEMRTATLEECEDLEPAAVWEPEHIADRLKDTFAGRRNIWLDSMRPSRHGKRGTKGRWG
jgi:hypothetical protein